MKLKKGDKIEILEPKKEVAVLLMEGKIKYLWENKEYEASRKNVFEEEGHCLHVCKNVKVKIEALDDSEVLIQKAENDKEFLAKLYRPEDVILQESSLDIWDGTAARKIKTFFDYSNAQYSNMVNGEIISYPANSQPPLIPWPVLFTGLFFNNLFYWCTNQSIVQKALGASSLKEAQKGAILAGLIKVLTPAILVIPGIIAFAKYGDSLPNADMAYPTLLLDVLPEPLLGIFAAVLFGAAMSSLNGAMNS